MKTNVKKNLCEPKSHFKRSHTPTVIVPAERRSYKRECRIKSVSSVTGRMTLNIEYKTVDRYEEMKDYRCSDFALENLIAINSPMQYSQLSMSRLSQADHVAEVLSSNIPVQ